MKPWAEKKNVRLVLLVRRPRVRICLPLGQSHFSHGFHTDLGQPRALYEVDSPQKNFQPDPLLLFNR